MPDQPRVQLRAVSKTFASVVALQGVDFDLKPGQVHALVGENGAGKSTLMRILAGQMSADHGRLVFEGAQSDLTGSAAGFHEGVGFVEQEGGLIAELSGAENLLLAVPSGAVADRRRAGRTITELAERFGGAIDPHLPVRQLAVGQRQRLEILIVMARGAQVLVLDEPTAALGTDEAVALGEIIRKFAAEGGSVVYISHKLGEVIRLADRITVMRRGRVVGSHESGTVTVEQLATEMVGQVVAKESEVGQEELLEVALGVRAVATTGTETKRICAVKGMVAPAPLPGEAALKGLDLDVHAGEIVGVAGVVGSGQTTLAEVLAGFIRPQGGSMVREGKDFAAYIPENRHRDAVALDLSLVDNLLLHSHRRRTFTQAGLWFNGDRVREHVVSLLDDSHVRYGHPDQPMRALSGGNQQKAVVGRELEEAPLLVVAHNPFRGLDVRAISEVRDALLQAAADGAGVVMISPDLDELRQIAHRIVVMFDGRIVGEISPDDQDAERLGQLMGGVA
ncbi:ABC transporter ATP-binding protein [Nocardioides aquiterrae]|uniref:ABC transporter ATP-binding protein n=2 Tax=Nocardioides aquiterrae TaxID=203799 RepID=A0ABN1UEE6_9ACTN